MNESEITERDELRRKEIGTLTEEFLTAQTKCDAEFARKQEKEREANRAQCDYMNAVDVAKKAKKKLEDFLKLRGE